MGVGGAVAEGQARERHEGSGSHQTPAEEATGEAPRDGSVVIISILALYFLCTSGPELGRGECKQDHRVVIPMVGPQAQNADACAYPVRVLGRGQLQGPCGGDVRVRQATGGAWARGDTDDCADPVRVSRAGVVSTHGRTVVSETTKW